MGAPKILELHPDILDGALALVDASSGIGVAENLSPRELIRFALQHGVQHIVQKESSHFDQEVRAARTMLEKPERFFSQPLSVICGNGKILRERRYSSKYKTGTPKETALSDFTAFLDAASGTRRISELALLAVDEFFTNATRNGWQKKPFSSDQEKEDFTGPVERPGTIEVFAHADSERLTLGCRDSYGLLEISQILKRLEACLANGVSESIRRGPGGAGIGSYLVFQTGVSYYAGVHRNQMTVVCVSFALGPKAKVEHEPAKNLHLVSL